MREVSHTVRTHVLIEKTRHSRANHYLSITHVDTVNLVRLFLRGGRIQLTVHRM